MIWFAVSVHRTKKILLFARTDVVADRARTLIAEHITLETNLAQMPDTNNGDLTILLM